MPDSSTEKQSSSTQPLNTLFRGFIRFFVGLFHYFFGFLEPRWKRDTRYVIKGATRYINYRKDIMRPEKLEELTERLNELKEAYDKRNKGLALSRASLVEQYVDTLPNNRRDALTENIEAFFVIFAIFFGLRAYVAQPFRIPTGSMQPSLNGIRAYDLSDSEQPGLGKKLVNMVAYGSSYKKATADTAKSIVGYQDSSIVLFTRTSVLFSDGSRLNLPGAEGEVSRLFLDTKGSIHPSFQRGETIVDARFDAGDAVLVNKMTYHFRKPKRGEVFVFDTRGIPGIHSRSPGGVGAPHYIKRITGLPGDTLQIKPPNLLVNHKPAQEKTIRRVEAGKPPYNKEGYVFAHERGSSTRLYLSSESSELRLLKNEDTPWLNEYAVIGDNTTNSLDSRYWGPLRQYNVIGHAMFNFWPFTAHWGNIP